MHRSDAHLTRVSQMTGKEHLQTAVLVAQGGLRICKVRSQARARRLVQRKHPSLEPLHISQQGTLGGPLCGKGFLGLARLCLEVLHLAEHTTASVILQAWPEAQAWHEARNGVS